MLGRRVGPILVVVAAIVGSCSSGESPPAGSGSLTVFAAASLKRVFTDIKTAYEATHQGARLTFSFDASSALEAQIAQGAPADVFVAADTKNPQKLVDGGFAPGPVTSFARNVLAVIVPATNPGGIRSPADLARPGVKVVGAGNAVPITTYANRLLHNLARQPGYPADFEAAVSANTVSREDNVAAVVSKIELGEGDAAIVYATDAGSSPRIAQIAVPDAANVLASYGAVAVGTAEDPEAAAEFVAWLAGPEGRAILGTYGFLAPP